MRLLEDGPLLDYVKRYWPHYFNSGDYRTVYRDAGLVEAKVDLNGVYDSIGQQWRCQTILGLLNIIRPQHALDFGCSRGAHAVRYHNELVNRWTCIDIDATSIEQARVLCASKAKVPSMFQFIIGNENLDIGEGQYDAVLLQEVLEHVADASALLEKAERWAKSGGHILLTVPSGPIEYNMWVEHPERRREHVRELQLEDLFEMAGHKQNLWIGYGHFGLSKYVPMHVGCYVVAYIADRQPLGRLDWTRKLSTERPRVELPQFPAQ